ncbi:MAG: isoaspartyl peptidase/L-asparaginase [Planctomycetes bacterium]|nr:isoaspartyl peptidase/L-asparaginase [Planctomycetota bacterium]
MNSESNRATRIDRRAVLGAGAAAAALACASGTPTHALGVQAGSGSVPLARTGYPVMVGSANALAGMKLHYAMLAQGADPLDAAIEVVKVTEADPNDTSVGLGGLPNEEGVVQLDAAVMHGPTHNSGAVACIENILHPSEVAKAVMLRTDHCLLVGEGAYRFARAHGHPHVDLLTDSTRKLWLDWKERHSEGDDWLPPSKSEKDARLFDRNRRLERTLAYVREMERAGYDHAWGTIHCSALSSRGEIACTTTTSGLAYKIPGRVGDSPIIGAGLYCDQEAGSAGATGRGEASILSLASATIVEHLRRGAAPLDAGLETLRRIVRQVERQSAWQPALRDTDGKPSFGLHLYVLALDGRFAGVTLKGSGKFAVADPEHGPRHEDLVPLLD